MHRPKCTESLRRNTTEFCKTFNCSACCLDYLNTELNPDKLKTIEESWIKIWKLKF